MVWERKALGADIWNELALDLRDGHISVRDELNQMLRDHGHEVFLRAPTKQRCACYKDGAFNDGNPNCPDCNGLGYYYLDTKLRAYRRPAFGAFSLTGPTNRSEIGDIGAADVAWYFPHTAKVSVGFIVVEVITDDTGVATKPYKIERKHKIRLAHLYREKQGRPEYWVTLAKELKLGT